MSEYKFGAVRMDKERALQATKRGAIVACLLTTLTLAVSIFAILNNSSGILELYNDPIIFFDILFAYFLAYWIYKKSLTAAVVMFFHIIIGRIIVAIETGQVTNMGMVLICLYFIGKAVQGAYVIQKIEKTENSNHQTKSKWIQVSIISSVVIYFSMVIGGLFTMTGVLTPTEVLEGKDLSEDYREVLIKSDIINQYDNIQYFYSEAFSRIEEAGSVLTSDRVITYLKDENNETAVYEIYFDELTDIVLIENGNFFNDSIYRVYAGSRDAYLTLVLSPEKRGDMKFIEALRSELKPK